MTTHFRQEGDAALKKFTHFIGELLGHQRIDQGSFPRHRPELTLPTDIMCAKCGEVVPYDETTSIWMPDEGSDYHRVCGDCHSQ